jgi:hypothetical protein
MADVCPVCLQPGATWRGDGCDHCAHLGCYLAWTERSARPHCPICRADVHQLRDGLRTAALWTTLRAKVAVSRTVPPVTDRRPAFSLATSDTLYVTTQGVVQCLCVLQVVLFILCIPLFVVSVIHQLGAWLDIGRCPPWEWSWFRVTVCVGTAVQCLRLWTRRRL